MKKCSILLAAVILLQTLCTAAPVLAAEQPWPTEYNLQGKEMPFRPEDKYVCLLYTSSEIPSASE